METTTTSSFVRGCHMLEKKDKIIDSRDTMCFLSRVILPLFSFILTIYLLMNFLAMVYTSLYTKTNPIYKCIQLPEYVTCIFKRNLQKIKLYERFTNPTPHSFVTLSSTTKFGLGLPNKVVSTCVLAIEKSENGSSRKRGWL